MIISTLNPHSWTPDNPCRRQLTSMTWTRSAQAAMRIGATVLVVVVIIIVAVWATGIPKGPVP